KRALSVADPRERKLLSTSSRVLQYGAPVVCLAVLVFWTFVSVDAGHVGVVRAFGKVEPNPLYEGLHIVMPWKDVQQMTTQIVKHESKYDAVSIDIQAVHTVMAINYAIDPAKAPDIYRSIGMGYESGIIAPAASEVLKATTAVHPANDILQQRAKIKADVQEGITHWLSKYGIVVREVSIKDIRFDSDFEKAVERKQIAQQLAQQKKYEVEQAQQDAAAMVARERGKGEAEKANAEGQAQALRIRGAAEAEYNTRVAQPLPPASTQRKYRKRGRGRLPQPEGGGGGPLNTPPAQKWRAGGGAAGEGGGDSGAVGARGRQALGASRSFPPMRAPARP